MPTRRYWEVDIKPINVTKRVNHGMDNTLTYHSWAAMKQRCYNPNHEAYYNYGGRGIIVCDRWKNSFLAFYTDMGERPSKLHQIDRIDNNGNYEPFNCQWSTAKEQASNRRPRRWRHKPNKY